MKVFNTLFIGLLLPSLCLAADHNNHIENVLNRYKDFLDQGTYYGINAYASPRKIESRYYTFKKAFEYFKLCNGKVIVELGSCNSFVRCGLPGCNLDDAHYWQPNNPETWDWGAGLFTRMAAECLAPYEPFIHTIDKNPKHIARCKIITQDFKHLISYHVCSSEAFLMSCPPESIDLLYIDTGDINNTTARLHLEEAKIIVERNLMSPNGIILIDDVRNSVPCDGSKLGCGKYAIPFLLRNGYEIMEDEYQVLLKKSDV